MPTTGHGYAAVRVPLYLPVDRTVGEVVLFSEPRGGDYRADIRVPLGKSLDLPEPFALTLDTGSFA